MTETEIKPTGKGKIWKPAKPGDKIVGELMAVRDFTGGEYGPSKIMDLRTNEGEFSIFADAVLKQYLDKLVDGRVYKITFLGWGRDYAAKKNAKNRYRQWKVTELVK